MKLENGAFAATRNGEIVVELGPTDQPTLIFSGTKGLVAMCLLLLIEPQPARPALAAPQGAASDGLGSATLPTMRDMLGRTLSSTLSASPICGVTFMMKPTATTLGVVVKVVTGATPAEPAMVVAIEYDTVATTDFDATITLRATREGTAHGFAMADLPVYNHDAAERHFQRTLELWRRNLSPQPVAA